MVAAFRLICERRLVTLTPPANKYPEHWNPVDAIKREFEILAERQRRLDEKMARLEKSREANSPATSGGGAGER